VAVVVVDVAVGAAAAKAAAAAAVAYPFLEEACPMENQEVACPMDHQEVACPMNNQEVAWPMEHQELGCTMHQQEVACHHTPYHHTLQENLVEASQMLEVLQNADEAHQRVACRGAVLASRQEQAALCWAFHRLRIIQHN
jgi:hypothetical protein